MSSLLNLGADEIIAIGVQVVALLMTLPLLWVLLERWTTGPRRWGTLAVAAGWLLKDELVGWLRVYRQIQLWAWESAPDDRSVALSISALTLIFGVIALAAWRRITARPGETA